MAEQQDEFAADREVLSASLREIDRLNAELEIARGFGPTKATTDERQRFIDAAVMAFSGNYRMTDLGAFDRAEELWRERERRRIGNPPFGTEAERRITVSSADWHEAPQKLIDAVYALMKTTR